MVGVAALRRRAGTALGETRFQRSEVCHGEFHLDFEHIAPLAILLSHSPEASGYTKTEGLAEPIPRMMTAQALQIQPGFERAHMAEFQTVCRVGDLADGEGTTAQVSNKLVAVFHFQGQYYAIDDVCPHMGASLAGGYVENGIVTCPWHAWRFRLADGIWADNPRGKLGVGCYPVRIVGNEVQVQVGGPVPGSLKTED
jgi:nitrite reductase (NADH) small subunit/3-phenylpropionate/trans-cinnamate dioxygenase ferredoxin subunit